VVGAPERYCLKLNLGITGIAVNVGVGVKDGCGVEDGMGVNLVDGSVIEEMEVHADKNTAMHKIKKSYLFIFRLTSI
jgi:hypothetical protein